MYEVLARFPGARLFKISPDRCSGGEKLIYQDPVDLSFR